MGKIRIDEAKLAALRSQIKKMFESKEHRISVEHAQANHGSVSVVVDGRNTGGLRLAMGINTWLSKAGFASSYLGGVRGTKSGYHALEVRS